MGKERLCYRSMTHGVIEMKTTFWHEGEYEMKCPKIKLFQMVLVVIITSTFYTRDLSSNYMNIQDNVLKKGNGLFLQTLDKKYA